MNAITPDLDVIEYIHDMYEHTSSRVLFSCHLAGFTHYEGPRVWNDLRIGRKLKLKAEPSNPVDPEAVAVFIRRQKIGYLPGIKNKMIAVILNAGHQIFECRVQGLDATAHPEQQVRIVVRVKK